MNNEHIELIDVLNDVNAKNFMARTKDNVVVKNKIRQLVRELVWIEKIEETIPFIDELVRNPRSYIVHEESLLPIEKTKKISKESLRHLAQNTSLIQDVDEKGNVKPLKLLNIFKETTYDLYENRFVYSLILNVKSFINDQLAKIERERKSMYIRTLKYNSETNFDNEHVKIKLEIVNQYKKSEAELLKEEEINDRIRKLNEIFSEFLTTKFALEMYGSIPVRSPLRKTNAILKDNTLKEAVNLWEFIESYDRNEAVKVVLFEKEDNVFNLDEKLKPLMYASYYELNNTTQKDKSTKEFKYSTPYIRNLIENYVSEYNTNEKEFKEMIFKEFKTAKDKKDVEYSKIINVYQKVLTNHDKFKNTALKFLKSREIDG